MVKNMESSIVLTDVNGTKYKVELLFTHFDYNFGKNYIVYLFDKDLLAASYETINEQYVINSDLSTQEYDMIDKMIERKLGDLYA